MKKVLHILPSGLFWKQIVNNWIGQDKDKHDIIQYPVPTNLHYLPESFSRVEMMKVAISWNNPDLYDSLNQFSSVISRANAYEKIVVWFAEDADSRLLLYTISSTRKGSLYGIDITPVDQQTKWETRSEDEYIPDEDPGIYDAGCVCPSKVGNNTYVPRRMTKQERAAYQREWEKWGGEDAGDCYILVNQFGELFHTHRAYLYSRIFKYTPKDEPKSIARITGDVMGASQLPDGYISDTIAKMANEGMIKWVKKDKKNPFLSLVQQYKYDVESDWLGWNREFVYQFIQCCGKKIKMSEDDLKAELRRDRKDCEDMWGQGHLTRAAKEKRRQEWEDRQVIKWASALNENWGWYHLMDVMKTKLEMMADYMRNWSPVANGTVYADQMERAIALMEIIIAWGGERDYPHTDDEEDYFDAEHFAHRVNFHNQDKYPSPDYDGHHFWCEAQRVRFDKAWNILWEMFRTKLITWDD